MMIFIIVLDDLGGLRISKKSVIICCVVGMLVLTSLPTVCARQSFSLHDSSNVEGIFGWTFIRGFVFNVRKVGLDLVFFAVRLRYFTLAPLQTDRGIVRLRFVSVSDFGPDFQVPLGPLGKFCWIIALGHGGIDIS